MEIRELSKLLSTQAVRVCEHLFPQGSVSGSEFIIGNLNGKLGDSLSISIAGEKAGVWKDFATDEKGGDLIELWKKAKGQHLVETLKEIHEFLGIAEGYNIKAPQKKFKRPKLEASVTRPESVVMRYLIEQRLLTPATIAKYDIREFKKNDKNWITFPYQRDGEVILIKYLAVERDEDGSKKFFASKESEPCLFGWDQLDPDTREVVITEGEINAMTLDQIGIPALAVPFGAGKDEKNSWLEYDYQKLERFDFIYLRADNDNAGDIMLEDLIKRLGRYRCKILRLPQDPNDCLRHGIDIFEYLANAEHLDPVELRKPSDLEEQVVEKFYPTSKQTEGFAPRFKKLYDKDEGEFRIRFRPGEVTIWAGYNHEGKSQMTKQMQLDAILQGEKSLVVDFEVMPEETLYRMVRSTLGMKRPSVELVKESLEWLSDNLWLLDWQDEAPLDKVLEAFAYSVKRFGITQFWIDSLMCLSDVQEDDMESQKRAINKLTQFTKKFKVHIHLVAHLRKPASGEVRDRLPNRYEVSGSSKLSDKVFNAIIVSRNRTKEDVLSGDTEIDAGKSIEYYKNQPDCLLKIDKQKTGTNFIGKIPLWWDQDSMQYLDHDGQAPRNYMEQYYARFNS